MAILNIKAVFPNKIEDVWRVVTSLEDFSWRSDLLHIDIINEYQFIEYTKNGYATTFTITEIEPFKRWEFDIENDNIVGHWIGQFTSINGQVEIDFSEAVTAKKIWMKPFVKIYLKKQQAKYVQDLTQALQRACR